MYIYTYTHMYNYIYRENKILVYKYLPTSFFSYQIFSLPQKSTKTNLKEIILDILTVCCAFTQN